MATDKVTATNGSNAKHWAATPEGKARLRKKALDRWRKIKAGEVPMPRPIRPAAVPVIREGDVVYRIAVMGLSLEEVAKVAAVIGNTHAISLEPLEA